MYSSKFVRLFHRQSFTLYGTCTQGKNDDCDWLWENLSVTDKDKNLEIHNLIIESSFLSTPQALIQELWVVVSHKIADYRKA